MRAHTGSHFFRVEFMAHNEREDPLNRSHLFFCFETPTKTRTMLHANSTTRRIVLYLEDHPEGATRKEIIEAVASDSKPRVVSCLLQRLQREKIIENRGGYAHYARWYVVDDSSHLKYLKIAEDLLEDLQSVHHIRRSEHLAKRLEEIFG